MRQRHRTGIKVQGGRARPHRTPLLALALLVVAGGELHAQPPSVAIEFDIFGRPVTVLEPACEASSGYVGDTIPCALAAVDAAGDTTRALFIASLSDSSRATVRVRGDSLFLELLRPGRVVVTVVAELVELISGVDRFQREPPDFDWTPWEIRPGETARLCWYAVRRADPATPPDLRTAFEKWPAGCPDDVVGAEPGSLAIMDPPPQLTCEVGCPGTAELTDVGAG